MAQGLHIGLDATLWDEPTTGIALYNRELASALERQGVGVRRYGARRSGDRPRGELGKSSWTVGRLPDELRAAAEPLFHAVCNFNLPLARVPGTRLVLTVHDLIPIVLPQSVSRAYRWQFRLWLGRSLQIADRVICVSEATRRDLVEHFPEVARKVRVVHSGVDHVHRVRTPDAAGETYLATLGLDHPFILYAGALDARKDVPCLLDACELLAGRGTPPRLVLVGQRWFGAAGLERRLRELGSRGLQVRWLGYQPDDLLCALLRRATVFAFPSRYEGFGLPPLEAMALGTPVVTTRAGALGEVCGDAATYFEPGDAQGLSEALSRLLDSAAERARATEAGRAQAARFTWDAAARGTLAVYEELLSG